MTRWTRDTWLDLGLQQLANAGLAGVAIEPLCAAAGKTTGSFYHHFVDHPSYLVALAEHWRTLATDRVIDAVENRKGGSAMDALTDLAFELDPRIEVRIRRLAERDEGAAIAIANVDRTRLDYLAKLYRTEFGAPAKLASDLARLDYAALMGFVLVGQDWDPATAKRIPKLLTRMTAAYLDSR